MKENRTDKVIYSFIKIIPNWISPNLISFIRILLLVPIIILLKGGQNLIATILFALAFLLDIFDGVLARQRQQITKNGEWLDPFTDKVLVLGILFFYGWSYLPAWLIITVTALEFLLVLGRPIKIKFGRPAIANIWGKRKMTCQGIATIGLTTGITFIKPLVIVLFLTAIVFAVLSFLTHLNDIFNFKIKR